MNIYIRNILEEFIISDLYVWWMGKEERVNEDVYKGRVVNLLGLVCGVRKVCLEEVIFYLFYRWVGV